MMEETIHFYCNNGFRILPIPYTPSHYVHLSSISPTKFPHFRSLSSKTSISLPQKPSKTAKSPSLPRNPQSGKFVEKLIYLESIGIDLFSPFHKYPQIISTSLEDIKSTVDFMHSLGFTSPEFSRICGMCPEILNSRVSDIVPVFTFLLREVNVKGSDLRRIINRRPRLLVCDVEKRLRPTLYFLQRLGISEVNRYTFLLSCSVEEKFIPRIEYLEKIGLSYRDTVSMVRRFPQLFCYSIKDNFKPKFDYFVVEMGRDLKELKEFPQYFSFSLQNRIKPRHQLCVEKGACFPLSVMLKMNEKQFRRRLEVCCSSSPPLKSSPLWYTNVDNYSTLIS